MTPVIPALDQLPLPAPLWLLWALLMLTFTLHVLAMNLVLGGSVVAAVSVWKARRGDPNHKELSRLVGKSMPVAISATVTLGVAALLFLQALYGRVFFTSSALIAWWWFAVVPLVIVAYYSAYAVAFHTRGSSALPYAIAAIFLAIAFVYTNNMTLMVRPEAFREMYATSGRGLTLHLADRMLLPRFLHMVAGAIAIGGLGVVALALLRRAGTADFRMWASRYGSRWFAHATIVNVAVGVWLLGSLPVDTLLQLIGRNAVASAVLAAGFLSAGATVAAILAAARSGRPGRMFAVGIGAGLATLALMILTRDFMRRTLLAAAGFEPARWIAPQWGPIAIFGVLLIVAVLLTAWMVATLVRAPAPGSVGSEVLEP